MMARKLYDSPRRFLTFGSHPLRLTSAPCAERGSLAGAIPLISRGGVMAQAGRLQTFVVGRHEARFTRFRSFTGPREDLGLPQRAPP